MRNPLLLLVLLVCHYLADFCLTTRSMIRAKADGRTPEPIILHAGVHALLVAIVLAIWGISWKVLLVMAAAEWFSHFLIDLAKARLSVRFPLLADPQQKPYWMLYGFDQLLHQGVLFGIWFYILSL